jgi:7-cyano-7-deazaguanine synthase
MPRVILLLSGGIDSAVLLRLLRRRGYSVTSLSIDYPGRNPREAEAAEKLAELEKSELVRLNLPFMREIVELWPDPGARPMHLKGAHESTIPARNAIIYSAAAYVAEIRGINLVAAGHNADDVKHFPDASPQFRRYMSRALSLGTHVGRNGGFRIIAPLSRLSKTQVVRLGLRLGVPFQYTWSCHGGESKPCGRCSGCVTRREAFRALGIADPLDWVY